MNLSPHFSLEEATRSDTAARLGIDNQPDKEALDNMIYTATKLEIVREHFGPLLVNSWYRGPELNASIPGSSKTSAHMRGYAIDLRCPKYPNTYEFACELHKFITEKSLGFDQIIHEYGSWVHLSFDIKNRGQLLTIFKSTPSKGYVLGILTKEQYAAHKG